MSPHRRAAGATGLSSAARASLAELYPDHVGVGDVVRWSQWSLARAGFHQSNALPLLGVCRDELMLGFAEAVTDAWGAPFDLGALAGMVFLGRTGIAAALGHAPGEDGRHRFVAFCFPHIGIDDDGTVGRVMRPGMHGPSAACGALAALGQELADGRLDLALDPLDLEMSLLRTRLVSYLRYGRVPTLSELTEAARDVAVADLRALVDGLASDQPVDVAYLSGVVIHTPDGGDLVGGLRGEVVVDGVSSPLDR
ncbi:MAG: hypothetical protein R2737_16245 [Candidatus Nanopelagicales bacterium]